MTTHQQPPVLVLGGTGKVGRRIAERLTARGVPVRIGARGATPAFDWTNPATWGDVLNGARAVFISYAPDLAVPGASQAIGALTRQAAAQGVQRVVLLSGRGEEEAEAAERLVQQAGIAWTIVRCSWFAIVARNAATPSGVSTSIATTSPPKAAGAPRRATP